MELTKQSIRRGFMTRLTAEVHEEIVMNDMVLDRVLDCIESREPIEQTANKIRIIFEMFCSVFDRQQLDSVDWIGITKSLAKSL